MSKQRAELTCSITEGRAASLRTAKENKKNAIMIIMCTVHISDSFTAERDLEYCKEISFKIKL